MTARTPAPKAEDYSVVPGSLGPRRDFRISVIAEMQNMIGHA
jgi:hypothetical protein